jgi:amino acid transporter/nucleotide-binding universal stress UspA family protein
MAGEPKDGVRVEVSRDLGLADVVGLGVGAMVGAGIFVLLAPATQVAGLSTLLALAATGLVVLLTAASYAELASKYPRAGGGYTWVKEGLPPPSGFLAGWTAWAGHSAALALSAMSLSAFALYGIVAILDWAGAIDMTSFLSNPAYVAALKVGAFLVILAFVFSSSFRGKVRARRLPWGLIIKIVLVLAFLTAAFVVAFVKPPPTSADLNFLGLSGWTGIPLAIAFTFVAYEGYEIIALSAAEVKQPHKTIPRGILISVGLVVLLYVLLEASLLSLARYGCSGSLTACTLAGPRAELSFATLALSNLGPGGAALLLIAGVVAMITAVGNNLSSAARLSFVMAKDGALFKWLGEGQRGGKMPNSSVLASGLLASIFVLLLDIPQMAMVASILYLILFALVDAALVAIHHRDREAPRGFRVPLVPLLPAIGIVTNLALAGSLWIFPALGSEMLAPGRFAWYVVILWITAGMFYHFFAGGKRLVGTAEGASKADLSDILATERKQIDLQRYRVFLPLREFTDFSLVRFGAQIAKNHGGELSLLNVVEIPRNLPPKAIKFSFVNDRIKELQRLTKMAGKEGVDARASVKIGHKVYEIIVDTLSEEDVNLLVLGWRGGRGTQGRILGSNLDYLIETAPCDVVVFKTAGFGDKLARLMVLAGPSFTLEGVSDIILTVAKNAQAEIRLLIVAGQEQEIEQSVKAVQPFVEMCRAAGTRIEQRTVVAKELEAEVRRASADCDVVFMSSPTPKGTRRLMLSPLEERLAKVLDKPVILFRKGVRELSF